jgi:hypothetical protein
VEVVVLQAIRQLLVHVLGLPVVVLERVELLLVRRRSVLKLAVRGHRGLRLVLELVRLP